MEVLPAPFGPIIALISPLFISKLTSRMALTAPKDRVMFSTDNIDSGEFCSLNAISTIQPVLIVKFCVTDLKQHFAAFSW